MAQRVTGGRDLSRGGGSGVNSTLRLKNNKNVDKKVARFAKMAAFFLDL